MDILNINTLEDILKNSDAILSKEYYLDPEMKKIQLKEKKIENALYIHHQLHKSIIFKNCEFEKEIIFDSRTKARGIKFLNCKFNSDVCFEGGEFAETVIFENCDLSSFSLSFKGGIFQTIKIQRGYFINLSLRHYWYAAQPMSHAYQQSKQRKSINNFTSQPSLTARPCVWSE